MEKIDAITNVTNNDLLNFTTESLAKTEPSGKFRFFMQSQVAKIDNGEKSDGKKALNMLNSLNRFTNIEKLQDELTISSENDKEDSRCCDSDLQELVDGIVGIIEGFGLLDYNTDESVVDEISQEIASIADLVSNSGENDINAIMENVKMLSEVIARMPNANGFESFMQEAGKSQQDTVPIQQNVEVLQQEITQMIEKLVSEYQCSFDNTNNTGVKDTDLTTKSEANQKPEVNKLKLMIKSAIVSAVAPESKRISIVKQKSTNNENSASDMEKNNSTEMLGKTMSKPLETTETVKDPALIAPTQEESAENIAKIAEKITASRIDGKQEFDVTLKPSSLGKLSIKLIMDGDSMKAQIKASDLYVKGIISEQLPELSQTLREKGVNMANIEVVYDNPMFSSTDSQFQGQSQFTGHNGQNMRSFIASDVKPEDLVYSAIMDNTDLSMMNSSVEFIA